MQFSIIRIFSLSVFTGLFPVLLSAQKPTQVDDLLKKMTIEEKVGQMTQLTLGTFVDMTVKDRLVLKKDEIKKTIAGFHIGSVLNNAQDHAQTQEEWLSIIKTIQDAAKSDRLGIPVLYGVDAIHGATYLKDAPLFPQQLGIACSRNPEHARAMGRMAALSTRACGIRWNFAPVLDVARSPLWSRFPETFGESTHLVKEMGRANIEAAQEKGIRGSSAVAACMKHFLAYSAANSGKDRSAAYLPDQILREVFLPPFREAVKAGARTVMINSGEINGVPVHASKYVMQDILRKELGFTGLAVSDWEDIIKLRTRHRVAETDKEAVFMAIDAGLDMSMVPYNTSFCTHLIELVKEGRISEARLDESVRRILNVKMELGLFENAYPEKEAEKNAYPAQASALVMEAARQSLVLLKNNASILPLKEGSKILVCGPAADNMPSLSGSWSYTWQGNDPKFYPKEALTILGALKKHAGNQNVQYLPGCDFSGKIQTDEAVLTAAAERADAVVLCLGEEAYAEIPGNIDDLNLPANQKELLRTLGKMGKPLVLVLAEGRPRLFTELESLTSAILLAPQPGTMGGEAVAEVLLGKANPSGKLAFNYPAFANALVPHDAPVTDVLPENNEEKNLLCKPLYPFGHGMSFTDFSFSGFSVSKTEMKAENDSLVLMISVTNTGKREGRESLDLFVRDDVASLVPALKRHVGFASLTLKPGQTLPMRFVLKSEDLPAIHQGAVRKVEPGTFTLFLHDRTMPISVVKGN
jgi:beta-glucosidase